MNWVIYLFFTIILIILGLVVKKSKIVWSIQIIWMWILMAGSNGGVDWTVHNNIFMNSIDFKIFGESWLYKLFCYPFARSGLGFYEFNFVISTILLFILFFLIKKYTKNICFVTSLIYIYPLADSIIQKRNFCALIIFLCGVLPLINREKKGNFKFLLFTFLAAQIHSSYYLYFIIYPLMKLNDKKLSKVIIVLLSVLFMSIPIIPQIASMFVNSSKVNFYFTVLKIPFYQSCCWWVLQVVFTYLFFKILKMNNFMNKEDKNENFNDENIELIKLNKILLLFMPLYYYEPTFFRYFRNLLFVNYIETSKIFHMAGKTQKKVFVITSFMCLFVLIVFLSQFVIFGKGFEYLGVPIFQDNLFIGG